MQFGQKGSHLGPRKSRPDDNRPQRVADERDPFRIEVVSFQIREYFRDESIRHHVKSVESSTLFI